MIATSKKDQASIAELCLSIPLYQKTSVSGDAIKLACFQRLSFDCHCIFCKKGSHFKRRLNYHHPERHADARQQDIIGGTTFTILMECSRSPAHIYEFIVRAGTDSVTKIGQYPSMETIAAADIERFRGVLTKRDFRELHRAGGLASHGVGIGSFVYLRRIFERLISRHYERHQAESGEIDGFDRMRMDERIHALRNRLPPILVETKSVYGVLSKGLHELEEDTCRGHFPVLRSAIMAILEDDLQRHDRDKAAAQLRSDVQRVTQSLSTEESGTPPDQSQTSEPVDHDAVSGEGS